MRVPSHQHTLGVLHPRRVLHHQVISPAQNGFVYVKITLHTKYNGPAPLCDNIIIILISLSRRNERLAFPQWPALIYRQISSLVFSLAQRMAMR